MFDFDKLSSRVSELKLGDIIEMGASEEDYEAGDVEEFETKRPVRVTLNHELIHLSGIIMKQKDCSSNMFYKSATKHGAIILSDMHEIKIVSDVRYILNTITEVAIENSDDFLYDIAMNCIEHVSKCSVIFKRKKPEVTVDKSIYPYPKWRRILDKYSYYLFVPKSLMYRGVIALSLETEFRRVRTAEEFYNNLKIYSQEILNIEGMLSMFKFSKGFIKNREYIINKIKRKKLTDEVKSVIYDAFDID